MSHVANCQSIVGLGIRSYTKIGDMTICGSEKLSYLLVRYGPALILQCISLHYRLKKFGLYNKAHLAACQYTVASDATPTPDSDQFQAVGLLSI